MDEVQALGARVFWKPAATPGSIELAKVQRTLRVLQLDSKLSPFVSLQVCKQYLNWAIKKKGCLHWVIWSLCTPMV